MTDRERERQQEETGKETGGIAATRKGRETERDRERQRERQRERDRERQRGRETLLSVCFCLLLTRGDADAASRPILAIRKNSSICWEEINAVPTCSRLCLHGNREEGGICRYETANRTNSACRTINKNKCMQYLDIQKETTYKRENTMRDDRNRQR